MSAAAFARKFHSIGACPEGRDWILAGKHADFRATWKVCPAAEFLAWVATRLLGVEGARAAVQCAKAAAKLYEREPLLAPLLKACDQLIEAARVPGAKLDAGVQRLQELAYDASVAALGNTRGAGEVLLSASYAAYCVAYAVMAAQAAQAKDAEGHKRLIAKAAQHASDAASHASEAMPGKGAGLVQVVRDSVKEDALVRAWQMVPEPRPDPRPTQR